MSGPNLQNIPIKSELGREIRDKFVEPVRFFELWAESARERSDHETASFLDALVGRSRGER